MVFLLCPKQGSGSSRAQYFRQFDTEARVVIFKDGDLALADAAAVDHDFHRFANSFVERDRGALFKAHQAGNLHTAGAQHDLDVDRDIHDQIEICVQGAARLLITRTCRRAAEIAAAETAVAAEGSTAGKISTAASASLPTAPPGLR